MQWARFGRRSRKSEIKAGACEATVAPYGRESKPLWAHCVRSGSPPAGKANMDETSELMKYAKETLKANGRKMKPGGRHDLQKLAREVSFHCGGSMLGMNKKKAREVLLAFAVGSMQLVERKHEKRTRDTFYESRDWLTLRYEVLRIHGARCQCCGNGPKTGKPLHVDHIKPRSKHPELQLDRDNLQVLCEDCNKGKSNIDETDWRVP